MIIVGLMALVVGVQEVRTDQPAIRRLAPPRGAIRRHGWLAVALGGFLVLFGLSGALGLPLWFDGVVLLAAFALAAWALITYKPVEPLGRKVDPPSDPDAVWKRNPPGY